MVTYQQTFEVLYKTLAEKSSEFIKAEKEISYDGFGDSYSLTDYLSKRRKFADAVNNYYTFLNYVKTVNAKPNDIFAGFQN